jgi:hypothetical protein
MNAICIDADYVGGRLHLGREYDIQQHSPGFVTTANNENQREIFRADRFKPAQENESAKIHSRIQRFESGDIVRAIKDHSACSYLDGQQFTVQLWIESSDGNHRVTFREIALAHDPRDFVLVKKKEPEHAEGPSGFWMVKGSGPTSYEHTCLESAEREAMRLAKEAPGTTFTVLGPICSYVTSEFQRYDLTKIAEDGEDLGRAIPF